MEREERPRSIREVEVGRGLEAHWEIGRLTEGEDAMRTFAELAPLGLGLVAVGAITWFLLDRGLTIGPWLLAGLLFAHGWVHLLFVFPQPQASAAAAGGLSWPFDMARSWLVTGAGFDVPLVRVVGIALMAVVFLGFVLAALSTVGLLVPATLWSGLLIGSAVASAVMLALFFSPLLLLGFAIDLVVLVMVSASIWRPVMAG